MQNQDHLKPEPPAPGEPVSKYRVTTRTLQTWPGKPYFSSRKTVSVSRKTVKHFPKNREHFPKNREPKNRSGFYSLLVLKNDTDGL